MTHICRFARFIAATLALLVVALPMQSQTKRTRAAAPKQRVTKPTKRSSGKRVYVEIDGDEPAQQASAQQDRTRVEADGTLVESQHPAAAAPVTYQAAPVAGAPAVAEPAVAEPVQAARPVSGQMVYESVDQMPEYPGGTSALLKYLASHIQFPPTALERGVNGRVILQFVVTDQGRVGEVKVAKSLDPQCDREAIRVVKGLPRFKPGMVAGRAVNVWYTLPIAFRTTE